MANIKLSKKSSNKARKSSTSGYTMSFIEVAAIISVLGILVSMIGVLLKSGI